jgi:tetratricopeptide (TPR) repeat protein
VKRVGRELGVRYVLEGSVRRTANRVRITTQLVDTLSGNHVWAEKYDGDLVDIFALQDEITASIARAIDPALRLAETQRAIRQPPLVAWDHFMRGAFHFTKYRPDDNATARRHFEAAIALDPHFALAHAQLARTHFFDAFLGWTDATERAFETAYREAERAVSLDELEAIAQTVLSITALYMHRHDTALAAGRRAAELNPNYPNGHGSLGMALIFEGRFEEGIACFRIAVRLSPYDSRTWTAFVHALTALGHYGTRDYAAAAQAAQESHSILDSNLLAQCVLAATFAQIDRKEDAHRLAAQLVGRSPALDRKQLAIQFPFRRVTDLENLLDGLRKAGLPE